MGRCRGGSVGRCRGGCIDVGVGWVGVGVGRCRDGCRGGWM